MTDGLSPEQYSPFELVTDAAALHLVTSSVSSPLGTCVARHPPVRSSVRATLFLHGAAGSWTTWTPLLQAAARADIDLGDVVIFDLPGWGDATLSELGDIGQSGHRDPSDAVLAVCSLVKELADTLGYTEWDLVGHSLGGFIALHMASIWPQAVRSVGMVSGTTFSVIDSVSHPVRNFRTIPGFTMLWKVMQLLAALGPVGDALVAGVGASGAFRVLASPLFRHWRQVSKSQGAALGREIRPRAFAAAARVAKGYDARALWGVIGCPVRATQGDRDIFVVQSDLERLETLIPGTVTTVIADCGHFGGVERPFAVLKALGYWPR